MLQRIRLVNTRVYHPPLNRISPSRRWKGANVHGAQVGGGCAYSGSLSSL